MQFYCESLTEYKRLPTREVKVGNLLLGNNHPIRVQTMTTTDTMDTLATVEQTIRCLPKRQDQAQGEEERDRVIRRLEALLRVLNCQSVSQPRSLISDTHM